MTAPFGHEKLIVYQKGLRFAGVRRALLDRLKRRVAACDHWDRGAESILVNIAHASSTWSATERIVYLGHANGSTLECAACLDVLVAKNLLTADDVYPGKSLLAEVVSMLITMRKIAADRVREEHAAYRTKKDRLFDHEDLDVYQLSLQLVGWLEPMQPVFSCSADLKAKLDKSTTSVVLNIAEGSGRFAGTNQATFYDIAYKAAVQSASLLDLTSSDNVEQGREWLRRIATMLSTLSKVKSHG
jgi:four helix bundle protein